MLTEQDVQDFINKMEYTTPGRLVELRKAAKVNGQDFALSMGQRFLWRTMAKAISMWIRTN
jgi:hypothetical protein